MSFITGVLYPFLLTRSHSARHTGPCPPKENCRATDERAGWISRSRTQCCPPSCLHGCFSIASLTPDKVVLPILILLFAVHMCIVLSYTLPLLAVSPSIVTSEIPTETTAGLNYRRLRLSLDLGNRIVGGNSTGWVVYIEQDERSERKRSKRPE